MPDIEIIDMKLSTIVRNLSETEAVLILPLNYIIKIQTQKNQTQSQMLISTNLKPFKERKNRNQHLTPKSL